MRSTLLTISSKSPPPVGGIPAALGLLLGLLGVGQEPALGQATFHTIFTHGPTANRVNLVVLSEGYTSNQLAQFLVDATNTVHTLLAHHPFAPYQPYFNAFAIAVPSRQSGSDHPTYGPGGYRDTYFNSSYGSSDYVITIPPNAEDPNYNNGQGKVDALLQAFMPECDVPILLVNDPVTGGSGGKVLITSLGVGAPEILLHESGHSLAGLGDEYSYPNPGFPDIEAPNTTRETRREYIKWKAWIAPETPIPTPPEAQYAEVIGLFEGAHYHATNWYRPKLDCAMRSLGVPFCEVCAEALILSFYQRVRPVDGFMPVVTNLVVTTHNPIQFAVSLLQPTQPLRVQWRTNGVSIPNATNASYVLNPERFGNGSHLVQAEVWDPTPWVRTDPTNLLRQRVTWSVSVALPALRLDLPQWLPEGRFRFRVTGVAPQGVAIQASTNFSHWVSVGTNFLVDGQFIYTSAPSTNWPRRFFRAVTPP